MSQNEVDRSTRHQAPPAAIEELKLLQAFIGKSDDISLKIKGWSITLSTAYIIALATGKLTNGHLTLLALLVPLLFLWLDVVFRVAQNRAIRRSSCIEEAIRGEREYDGPRIAKTLSQPNNLREQWQALNNVRMHIPYSIQIVALALAGSLS